MSERPRKGNSYLSNNRRRNCVFKSTTRRSQAPNTHPLLASKVAPRENKSIHWCGDRRVGTGLRRTRALNALFWSGRSRCLSVFNALCGSRPPFIVGCMFLAIETTAQYVYILVVDCSVVATPVRLKSCRRRPRPKQLFLAHLVVLIPFYLCVYIYLSDFILNVSVYDDFIYSSDFILNVSVYGDFILSSSWIVLNRIYLFLNSRKKF